MKRTLLLCAMVSAALAMGGCASQSTADVNGTGAQRGTIYGVSGSLGGGGGSVPNRNNTKSLP